MAGRIRDEDVALVRERAPIDEIIGEHVALRRAGNRLKGLCPFHDEKIAVVQRQRRAAASSTASAAARAATSISFVQKIEDLDFREAVERLGRQLGITLTLRGRRRPPTAQDAASAGAAVEANKAAAVVLRGAAAHARGRGRPRVPGRARLRRRRRPSSSASATRPRAGTP